MNNNRPAALTTLGYFVGWLRSVPAKTESEVAGPGAKPWCEVLETLTRSMAPDLRPVVIALLDTVNKHAATLSDERRRLTGFASRRVLEFAWAASNRDAPLIRRAIE